MPDNFVPIPVQVKALNQAALAQLKTIRGKGLVTVVIPPLYSTAAQRRGVRNLDQVRQMLQDEAKRTTTPQAVAAGPMPAYIVQLDKDWYRCSMCRYQFQASTAPGQCPACRGTGKQEAVVSIATAPATLVYGPEAIASLEAAAKVLENTPVSTVGYVVLANGIQAEIMLPPSPPTAFVLKVGDQYCLDTIEEMLGEMAWASAEQLQASLNVLERALQMYFQAPALTQDQIAAKDDLINKIDHLVGIVIEYEDKTKPKPAATPMAAPVQQVPAYVPPAAPQNPYGPVGTTPYSPGGAR